MPADIPRSAGALIDAAGAKGLRHDGAVVSPIHANFIVADRGTRAASVRRLIEQCRTGVAARFGVVLRDEIVFPARWSAW